MIQIMIYYKDIPDWLFYKTKIDLSEKRTKLIRILPPIAAV